MAVLLGRCPFRHGVHQSDGFWFEAFVRGFYYLDIRARTVLLHHELYKYASLNPAVRIAHVVLNPLHHGRRSAWKLGHDFHHIVDLVAVVASIASLIASGVIATSRAASSSGHDVQDCHAVGNRHLRVSVHIGISIHLSAGHGVQYGYEIGYRHVHIAVHVAPGYRLEHDAQVGASLGHLEEVQPLVALLLGEGVVDVVSAVIFQRDALYAIARVACDGEAAPTVHFDGPDVGLHLAAGRVGDPYRIEDVLLRSGLERS